jgi:hypothetical protein
LRDHWRTTLSANAAIIPARLAKSASSFAMADCRAVEHYEMSMQAFIVLADFKLAED